MNELEKTRWFQWIAGDRKGEVLILDKIESEDADVYLVFKDASRINETLVGQLNQRDLTGKFMAEVDSPRNVWSFKEEWVGREEEKWEQNAEGIKVCVQPFSPGKKVIKLIPPKSTPANHSAFGRINSSFQTSTTKRDHIPASMAEYASTSNIKVDTSDPIYILISKSKRTDSEVSMDITISLPPKTLYNIAKESFEEGGTKFVEYIIGDIAVDKIQEALKTAITEMYEKSEGI
jgi:hypothetical protein